MTLRSAGDWIDDAPHGDNPADWFRWIHAIQRDALTSANDACKKVASDYQRGPCLRACEDCAEEIAALIPEEPKP